MAKFKKMYSRDGHYIGEEITGCIPQEWLDQRDYNEILKMNANVSPNNAPPIRTTNEPDAKWRDRLLKYVLANNESEDIFLEILELEAMNVKLGRDKDDKELINIDDLPF